MFNFTSYYVQDKSTGPVTKEELGKATWTFLHTLAAQVDFYFFITFSV